MSRTTWIVIGAAATLYILHRKQQTAAVSAADAGMTISEVQPADGGSLAPVPSIFGSSIWRDSRPVDATVHEPTSGSTNPLGDWLRTHLGLNVPMIAPRYLANASSPVVAGGGMTPAGSYQEPTLGQPAVPATWNNTPDVPASIDLGDPAQLMSIMVLGDEAVYIPDPILY